MNGAVSPKLERNVSLFVLPISPFGMKEAQTSALCTERSAVLLYDFSTILYWVFFFVLFLFLKLAHEPTYPIISMMMMHLSNSWVWRTISCNTFLLICNEHCEEMGVGRRSLRKSGAFKGSHVETGYCINPTGPNSGISRQWLLVWPDSVKFLSLTDGYCYIHEANLENSLQMLLCFRGHRRLSLSLSLEWLDGLVELQAFSPMLHFWSDFFIIFHTNSRYIATIICFWLMHWYASGSIKTSWQVLSVFKYCTKKKIS